MTSIHVSAERSVGAPADQVFSYLADVRGHRHHFLPSAYSDLVVESGGEGAGTVFRYTMTAGGRTRAFHMEVEVPEPGRVLTETDTASSLVTTWTVTPQQGMADAPQVTSCTVAITTTWEGSGGIGGFFERRFAPRALRGIYAEQLERLDTYAR